VLAVEDGSGSDVSEASTNDRTPGDAVVRAITAIVGNWPGAAQGQ